MEGVGEYTALLQRKWSIMWPFQMHVWLHIPMSDLIWGVGNRAVGGQWGGGGNHTFIMSPNVFTALVWSCRVVPWSLWCIHSHCDTIYKFLGKNSTLLMSCKNVAGQFVLAYLAVLRSRGQLAGPSTTVPISTSVCSSFPYRFSFIKHLPPLTEELTSRPPGRAHGLMWEGICSHCHAEAVDTQ